MPLRRASSPPRVEEDNDSVLPAPVLVDGHVHYYECFGEEQFLNAASTNFAAAAAALGAPRWTGCLFLTERSGDHWFDRWRNVAARGQRGLGKWILREGQDGIALIAEGGTCQLVLVAGRQMVSREGLEVLALGCAAELPDGLDLQVTLRSAAKAGAIVVLPWGVGKWRGQRGRLVRQLIGSADPQGLFLGDNAGRLGIAGFPKLLASGASPADSSCCQEPILCRSSSEGAAGWLVWFRPGGPLRTSRAGAELVRLLRALTAQPPTFGHPADLSRFLLTQVRIQWRKRLGQPPWPIPSRGHQP